MSEQRWNASESADLYGIDLWSSEYFSTNSEGHVVVRPNRSPDSSISLLDIINRLKKKGVNLPVLLRFDGIIKDRIASINRAFQDAIDKYGFKGSYRLAYPIKVNQQRHVIDSIYRAGVQHKIGFEVGSKPELLGCLGLKHSHESLLLCNGYKDDEYLELALLARKMGRRTIIIVEQPYEIDYVLQMSAELGIDAELGLRMKPSSKGSGRWASSGGSGAKFGLTSYELVDAIEKLKRHGKTHWISLVHFHIGSQVTAIKSVKKALREAARMYAELAKQCESLKFFDVGGGLAVDYDGSSTASDSSMNYTTEEYARDVVWAITEVCEREGLAPPEIISESGRATVAHHAVMITEVTDVAKPLDGNQHLEKPPSDNPSLQELYSINENLTVKRCSEAYHDIMDAQEVVSELFMQGSLSLDELAYAHRTIKMLLSKIHRLTSSLKYLPEELSQLDKTIQSIYFCNFSVFQSLPDSWAIDQLFPILPIHRLDEQPTKTAVIGDLTCDSDGQISRFVHTREVAPTILLHEYEPTKPYYLGIFLVGAYQETLGDIHNLFGDTHAVHIDVNEKGEIEFNDFVEGDTVREVLSYVQFDMQQLTENFRVSAQESVTNGTLTDSEAAMLIERYQQALSGYTYLVVENE